jgi:hypothetical protein
MNLKTTSKKIDDVQIGDFVRMGSTGTAEDFCEVKEISGQKTALTERRLILAESTGKQIPAGFREPWRVEVLVIAEGEPRPW